MKRTYLEVTFRKGKMLAAYLYLPRLENDRAVRVESISANYNVDYAADGRPIGVEIIHPASTTLTSLNAVLTGVRMPHVDALDLRPLVEC